MGDAHEARTYGCSKQATCANESEAACKPTTCRRRRRRYWVVKTAGWLGAAIQGGWAGMAARCESAHAGTPRWVSVAGVHPPKQYRVVAAMWLRCCVHHGDKVAVSTPIATFLPPHATDPPPPPLLPRLQLPPRHPHAIARMQVPTFNFCATLDSTAAYGLTR